MMDAYLVSSDDLIKAHETFLENEPRDLFYRVATFLIESSLQKSTDLSVAEALAVLLQTWNSSYYRFHGKFGSEHFIEIGEMLNNFQTQLKSYRDREIKDVGVLEKEEVKRVFNSFEVKLGPVGAAKALHLLAPKFFPLWDREIAKAYQQGLEKIGSNAEKYWKFILIAQSQYQYLIEAGESGSQLLKRIDEYNYCRYTKKWFS